MMSPYTPPPQSPLRIAHIDAHCLIVDKPAGLLSVPGRGPEKADCLISRVQADHPDALIVHRLDMETSGLIVLARGSAMQRDFSMMFEARKVDKTYTALIDGVPTQTEGEVALPLAKDWPNRPRQCVNHETGKPSLTHWHVVAAYEHCARVALTPFTGRTHQLRVHMDAIGHPILGDSLYGTPRSQSDAGRLCLHASALTFIHPATGMKVQLVSKPDF